MTTELLDRPKLDFEIEVEESPSVESLLRRLPSIDDVIESEITPADTSTFTLRDEARSLWWAEEVERLALLKKESDPEWNIPESLEEFLSDIGVPSGYVCEKCKRLVVHGEWPRCGEGSKSQHGFGHGNMTRTRMGDAPIVYYEGKNGELRFGDYRHMGIEPKRFERREMKDIASARKFEKRVNQQEYDKYDRSQVREQMTFEPAMKEHSSEARRKIKTEQGKEMLRQAQELNVKKSRKPKFDSGFRVSAYSD
jgi:hypothetical protein